MLIRHNCTVLSEHNLAETREAIEAKCFHFSQLKWRHSCFYISQHKDTKTMFYSLHKETTSSVLHQNTQSHSVNTSFVSLVSIIQSENDIKYFSVL